MGLIIRVNVETTMPQCGSCETFIRLYISDTLIKKVTGQELGPRLEDRAIDHVLNSNITNVIKEENAEVRSWTSLES